MRRRLQGVDLEFHDVLRQLREAQVVCEREGNITELWEQDLSCMYLLE